MSEFQEIEIVLLPEELNSSEAQIREIAEKKMPDLNAGSVEAAMRTVAGTARSAGVTVEG